MPSRTATCKAAGRTGSSRREAFRLVKEQGWRVIISSDIWLIPQVLSAARNLPDIIFEGFGWSKYRPPNVGMDGIIDMPSYWPFFHCI
jgi:hypothetical protein